MKQFLISILILFLLLLPVPSYSTPEFGLYVAAICTYDRAYLFKEYSKYKTDYLATLLDWKYLEPLLKDIKEKAKGQKVFLDFLVHGDNNGLYLQYNGSIFISDRASFGYVLNRVRKYFNKDNAIVCFESCYPAAAYKNTIRWSRRKENYR